MTKTSVGLRLEKRLIERIDQWRERQIVVPSRTAVVEQALYDFLARNEAFGEQGKEQGNEQTR